MTQRGFGIAATVPHDVVRPLAAHVERLGYTSFWVNDVPGFDGLESLAVAAEVTATIRLGVGVIPLDDRDGEAIAAQAQALPLDRVILGVGSGRATRALDLVRSGVSVLASLVDCPIVVGALGPNMARLGGEVADGVLLNWMTPAYAASLDLGSAAALRMAYVRCGLLPQARARLDAELERYSGIATYERHVARMGATVRDTCVVGDDRAALAPGLAAFDAVLDETVVRAVTADDALDSLVELAEACAP